MAGSARRRILEDSDEESVDSMDFDQLPTSGLTQRPSQSSQQSQSPTRDAPPPPSSASAPRPPPQHQQSALAARLENEGGVRPSPRWLEQCLRHVGNNNAEGAWHQILRTDLRDVVREDDATNASLETTAAQQLRNAVAQSRRNAGGNPNEARNGRPQSPKATLPSSFRLLVQVEEVVDASMNAEQQLAAMGGGNAAGAAVAASAGNRYNNNNGGGYQPGRNPKAATLKMTLSDGYYADGRAFSSDGKENDSVLEAYAPAPIQRLSIASPPGTKLLLHGSIDIRVGLLQLNEGNCTVMGGEIEEWKGIWKKAREKAQREKGLGVDPTIKALIWNPLMGDEEEADEGEGESGDVTGAPAVPPPAFQAAPPPAAPPAAQPSHQLANNANSNMHSYNANANAQPYNQNRNQSTSRPNNSYASAQNWNQNQSSSTANAPSRSTGGNNAASRNAGNMRQMTLDSYPKQPRPETTRLLPKDNAPSRPMAQQQISNNPYQRGGNSGGGGSNPYAGNRAPPQPQQMQQQHQQPQQQPQQQQRQQQPAMRSDVDVIPIDDSPPAAAARKPSPQQPKTNPYSSLRPPAKESAPVAAATASATFNSNPSFSELKSILQSMRSDRALYEQYYGKTITVPCKIDGAGEGVFNIVKAGGEKKKGKSKKEKKYEFLLVRRFFGPKQSDGAIVCRVQSSLLEPYFDGYNAAEVRRLSREDKQRATRIVNQNSQTFLHDFSSLGQVSMKLLLTADEFFTKTAQAPPGDGWMSDTGNAFLLVTKRA